jgi:menaquinone-dependent protoporphyrinogen oxidase
MARILIVFGTTHGHTATIASRMSETLRAHGHEVTAVSAAAHPPSPVAYDAVLVAASVHAGYFQKEVTHWVHRYAEELNRVSTGFVSVCLGVLQKDAAVQEEIRGINDRFLLGCGWRPRTIVTVAGALAYTKYNLVTRWIMRNIAARAGGDTDTSRDYEYTDWTQVNAFCEAFAAGLVPAPQPVGHSEDWLQQWLPAVVAVSDAARNGDHHDFESRRRPDRVLASRAASPRR